MAHSDHRWSNQAVEEMARALYNRWRYQGMRLGLEVTADDPRVWAEAEEGQRQHFLDEARAVLDSALGSYNK